MLRNSQKKQREMRRKAELKKGFETAKSTDEMLKLFNKMESCFQEKELSMEIMTLANEFLSKSPEKAVSFGKRALKILIDYENENLLCSGENAFGFLFKNMNVSSHYSCGSHLSSLLIARVLVLLGFASLDLKRNDECLCYANWAVRNLGKLQERYGSCPGKCVLPILLRAQSVLVNVKEAMGKGDEVVVHLRKILEIQEQTLERGCIEIGKTNRALSSAYLQLLKDSKEALPFCLEALEIYEKHLGSKSVEVADIRKYLAYIYRALGEYEKSLEQILLALSGMTRSFDLRSGENHKGLMLMELGRYEEAVTVFKGVVSRTNDKEKDLQATALIFMAQALFILKKIADAKKCLRTARGVVEKKGMDPVFVTIASKDMSQLDEKIHKFETAISKA